MQLYTLYWGVIGDNVLLDGVDIARTHDHIAVIFIVGNIALDQDCVTDTDGFQLGLIANLIKYFEIDGAGIIGDRDTHDEVVIIPSDAAFRRKNITPNNR